MNSIFIVGVYILLAIGIFGVIFLDNIWQEIGYLFVVFLMLDILYERYYNAKKNHLEKNYNGN